MYALMNVGPRLSKATPKGSGSLLALCSVYAEKKRGGGGGIA